MSVGSDQSTMHPRDYTVWSAIRRNAAVYGNGLAFRAGDRVLSHAEFASLSEDVAAKFTALGLKKGDRLAILGENSLETHLLFGACARSGVIAVPLNWRLSADELSDILADCEPALLVSDSSTAALVQTLSNAASGMRSISVDEIAGVGVLSSGADLAAACPEPGTDDVFALVYTAATDGFARGAMITHGNMIAAAAQLTMAIRLQPDDVFLANLPSFHIMGIGFGFAVQFAGGTNIVRPRFDAGDAASTIAEHRVTTIGTFPPMLAGILDASKGGGHDLSMLRRCIGLEAPAVIARFESEWPDARFWTGFGQTETTGMVTLGLASLTPGSSGQAGALSEVGVVDEEDRLVARDAVGEIVVRGPTVMRGYWRRDEENGVVGRNGWHHTGDLARIGEGGHLHYAGRTPAKRLIKSGGENVYPTEVEQALLLHSSVAKAAVIGLPDEHWGEIVAAVVVAHEGHQPDADELARSVAGRIAGYKRPRRVVVVQTLPTTDDGRIDRDALARLFET